MLKQNQTEKNSEDVSAGERGRERERDTPTDMARTNERQKTVSGCETNGQRCFMMKKDVEG